MPKCLFCGKTLTNPKAKFCSDAHRMAYRRKLKKPEHLPEQKSPEQPQKPEQTFLDRKPELPYNIPVKPYMVEKK